MLALRIGFALVVALAAVGCSKGKDKDKADEAAQAEPAVADPVAKEAPPDPAAGGADQPYRHGSQHGEGVGGGDKKSEGEKVGAGGFRHGSQKGTGDGGGEKKAEGPKSGKQPEHGSGKWRGTGGGEKDGEGEKTGVFKKVAAGDEAAAGDKAAAGDEAAAGDKDDGEGGW
jgi:hypothetical protein